MFGCQYFTVALPMRSKHRQRHGGHATSRSAPPRPRPRPRVATPRTATPRHAQPRHATPRNATPRPATPSHATPHDAPVRRAKRLRLELHPHVDGRVVGGQRLVPWTADQAVDIRVVRRHEVCASIQQSRFGPPHTRTHKCMLPRRTAHHTTPHRTAPHRTAPHRTAPHRTAQHSCAPVKLACTGGCALGADTFAL